MLKVRSKDELQEYVNSGNKVKYVFFWGHQNKGSEVTKSCFSQWYESAFTEDGVEYLSAEHYMMAEKAKLFGDHEILQKIICARNAGEAKALGREVRGFDEDTWVKNRFGIVVAGNLLKFQQNKGLGMFLLGTNERVLVEASPVDTIWGVGLAADNKSIENPNLWRGLNLLGFALMEVRECLRFGH
ncbi:NADAR family protein [Marinobacter nauticus]|nr:NADAR family protein [Marinobacter nauticus]